MPAAPVVHCARYVRHARGWYVRAAYTHSSLLLSPRKGKLPSASGTDSTQQAGTRSPYAQSEAPGRRCQLGQHSPKVCAVRVLVISKCPGPLRRACLASLARWVASLRWPHAPGRLHPAQDRVIATAGSLVSTLLNKVVAAALPLGGASNPN